jgi:hypothetical protein
VRFTHHARNKLRGRKLRGWPREAESVVENPIGKSVGRSGNPRYLGYVASVLVWMVVASDDPDLIVTVFPEERG